MNEYNVDLSLYSYIVVLNSIEMLMNVLIPVRITAAQMQHVLILVSVPVTVITLEMASHVKV